MSGREVALITGASMGIGKELAKVFAADGRDVVLVARSEDKLRALGNELESAHGITAHVVPADLTDPTAPASIFAAIESKGVELDYLVNNAGFGASGAFAELSLEWQLEMVQVNVNALMALSHMALQGMIAPRKGPNPEHRLDSCVPARARHGGVLRDEVVRAAVLRSRRRRGQEHRGHRHRPLPWSDGDALHGYRRQRQQPAIQDGG